MSCGVFRRAPPRPSSGRCRGEIPVEREFWFVVGHDGFSSSKWNVVIRRLGKRSEDRGLCSAIRSGPSSGRQHAHSINLRRGGSGMARRGAREIYALASPARAATLETAVVAPKDQKRLKLVKSGRALRCRRSAVILAHGMTFLWRLASSPNRWSSSSSEMARRESPPGGFLFESLIAARL